MTNIYIADTVIKYRAEIKGTYSLKPHTYLGIEYRVFMNGHKSWDSKELSRINKHGYNDEQYAIELGEMEKARVICGALEIKNIISDKLKEVKGFGETNYVLYITPAQLAAIESGSKYIFTDDVALINTIKEMMG